MSGFKTLNVEAKMWKSSRMMACKLVSFTKTRTPEKDHVWLDGGGGGDHDYGFFRHPKGHVKGRPLDI